MFVYLAGITEIFSLRRILSWILSFIIISYKPIYELIKIYILQYILYN